MVTEAEVVRLLQDVKVKVKVYKMLQESVGDVQLVRQATDVDGLIVDVAVEEEPP